MEKPKDTNKYHEIKVDGITVYVNKLIEAKDRGLELRLSGISIFKSIQVSGVKLDL